MRKTLTEYIQSQSPEELKHNLQNIHKKLDEIFIQSYEELRKLEMKELQKIMSKGYNFDNIKTILNHKG